MYWQQGRRTLFGPPFWRGAAMRPFVTWLSSTNTSCVSKQVRVGIKQSAQQNMLANANRNYIAPSINLTSVEALLRPAQHRTHRTSVGDHFLLAIPYKNTQRISNGTMSALKIILFYQSRLYFIQQLSTANYKPTHSSKELLWINSARAPCWGRNSYIECKSPSRSPVSSNSTMKSVDVCSVFHVV